MHKKHTANSVFFMCINLDILFNVFFSVYHSEQSIVMFLYFGERKYKRHPKVPSSA